MHARVSSYDLGGASKDEAAASFDRATPAIEEMRGNLGGMLLVDSEHGKALTITFWESEDAVRESERTANSVRQEVASTAGVSVTDVDVYEVALDFGR
jgi:heme-degrading monooxygenase HmoA